MPTSPATAPDSSMDVSTMRLTLTPLATAADSDEPVARRSKPKRVRPSSTVYATPASTAMMMKPNTSRVLPWISGMPGKWPDSVIGLVPMLLLPATSTLTLRSR